MNGHNSSNGERNGENTPKRKQTFKEKSAMKFKRTFGQDDVFRQIISRNGPIYPIDEDSFYLRSKYAVDHNIQWDNDTNPDGIVPIVIHPGLAKGKSDNQPLTTEQKEGIQFLWDCYENNSGGILAHDMGLGKTRTGVTIVATLLQQSPNSKGKSTPGIEKCIIMAPKNAVRVWEDEFDKWCPDDIPCKVISIMPGQKDGWDVANAFASSSSHHNVMILSYETFQKYNVQYKEGFYSCAENSIGLVICDEAHCLKNPGTTRAKNLKSFKGANLWIGFTGTPYQNSLDQLCDLVTFFRRNLADENLISKYCKPITGGLRRNKRLNEAEKAILKDLRGFIRPALHFKKNSFDIERHEIILCIPLDGHPNYGPRPEDGDDDTHNIQHMMYELVCECMQDSEISFFEKLSYLHKACIHPTSLYQAIQKHAGVFDKAIKYYEENFASSEDLKDEQVQLILPQYSAKINVVTKMACFVRDHCPNEKMIMVSSSTVLLEMVKRFLLDAHKIKSLTYDGSKTENDRARCLENFQTDDSILILLLSLKAGGTALTLTRANHLVLMDPDYNPSNDSQAIARIYRPGQNRKAFIYRMLASGTLEEVKYIKQLDKDYMRRCIQANNEDDLQVQAKYDEKDLVEYHKETKSFIREVLDKLDIENFNEEYDSSFAEEIKNSKQYWGSEVPENLTLVKHIWEYVSYAFYIPKIPDPAERMVLEDQD